MNKELNWIEFSLATQAQAQQLFFYRETDLHASIKTKSASARIKNCPFSCAYVCACVRLIEVKTKRRTSTSTRAFVQNSINWNWNCQSLFFIETIAMNEWGSGTATQLRHISRWRQAGNSVIKTNRLAKTIYTELSNLSCWCRHKSKTTLNWD